MTTSGSTSYNPVRSVIVDGALRLCGAYSTGMSPTTEQLSNAYAALNLLLKSWQIAEGLWLRQFIEIVLIKDQVKYNLPGAAGGVDLVSTTATGDKASGATTIDVTSVSEVTAGDAIYIVLDDDTLHTSTVSSIATLEITFADATAAALSEDCLVFAATATFARPRRIFTQDRADSSNLDVPIFQCTREEYTDLSNKTTTGKVVQIYYDPQLVTGNLFVWPAPDTTGDRLKLTIDRILQDMNESDETYDVPQEWLECLKYRLATRLAPEYAMPISERTELRREYTALVEGIKDQNIEHVSTTFGVDGSP